MADSALAEGQNEHRARLRRTVRRTPDDCNASAVHEYSGLRISRFAQTKYPLTGAHSALAAIACHIAKIVAKIPPSTDCYACHRSEDVHQDLLGHSSERRHTTE
jgi:hypothetical protein